MIVSKELRADLLMILTAAIWGTAFVAQRAGMNYIGPFTYNAVRFALGALSLIPFLFINTGEETSNHTVKTGRLVVSGLLAGALLFFGSSFQQVGLVTTTAGNAGFITGLYVILVPMLALFVGHRPGFGVWLGAVIAVAGLYFINETEGLHLSPGDSLVMVSALFFALHVLIIGWLSPQTSAVPLSIAQFAFCSLFSFIAAGFTEEIRFSGILEATIPILYGGVGSVGIAYTLQVVGQKNAPPGHAAIILSLESVFALLGGWLILSEAVPGTKLLGCFLMLAGMLSAQIQRYWINRRSSKPRSPSF
jgi:drug/metabolite transporter (DMT)-like permease